MAGRSPTRKPESASARGTSRTPVSARTVAASAKRVAASKTAKSRVPSGKTGPEKVVAKRSAGSATAAAKKMKNAASTKEGPIVPTRSEKGSKGKKPVLKKPKLIRDSFTFPEEDYANLSSLKHRALSAGREIKKSELLRAGLTALMAMSEVDLLASLDGVRRIKTGRPAK